MSTTPDDDKPQHSHAPACCPRPHRMRNLWSQTQNGFAQGVGSLAAVSLTHLLAQWLQKL
ncbi:hypothetical protein [Streptomyces sp. NPDC020141]|uniref:hypothetical protein n=1 Tax=Streptomyces sp. NPDC020141 TaxID=3365065 RepID=UPI0037B98BAC